MKCGLYWAVLVRCVRAANYILNMRLRCHLVTKSLQTDGT